MPPKAPPKYDVYSEPPEFNGTHNWDRHIERVLQELLRIYNEDIFPVEEIFKYDTLRPSWFGETISQKRPFVTILGPYSAGKSTFINYLMQSNYLLTGPQPTTDKFTVIMHGEQSQQISGKVLCADQSQPFRGLNQFGEKFIECFGAVTAPHPILKSLSIIDTPGLLENQEGDHKRRYDYMNVCKWFVERSDLVCILFDPTKLDVGVELRNLFTMAVKGNETKVRLILNKADSVTPQELMRIYGGLFWNLSKLVKTTEPPRVYVSSFWDQPYKPDTNHALFTDEKSDLIYDLTEAVPLQSLDNRVTSVISRCKAIYNHMIVCTHLKEQLPIFGKEKAIKDMVANLPQTYKELAHKNKCNPEDFPHPSEYEKFFDRVDLTKLPDAEKCARKGWFAVIDKVMGQDLPALLKPIKSAPVADPRDRKHALMVQREYNTGMQRQLQGEKGVQGALGEAATPAYRAEAMPNALAMQAQMQAQQQAQVQAMIQQQHAAMLQLQNMQHGSVMGGPNNMGMYGMQPVNPQLALMPGPGMGMMPMQQMGGGMQQQPVPNMSHDQLLRLTQMMTQQQPNRPYAPRF